ncbi:MAG: hypothetical protein E6713_17065 [Sporomusaceae bacterium]|nr:hypothetical protein [Sporomusaceae bacterium]
MNKYAKALGALLGLIFWCSNVFAAASANDSGAAQTYAIKGVHLSDDDFMAPWRSYEEKTQKLNDSVDQAYCYTPFLVVAIDARNKLADHLPVYVPEGEKLWQDYAGFLTFAVQLYQTDSTLPQGVAVWLEQDQKIFSPVQSNLPSELKVVAPSSAPVAGAPKPRQLYLFAAYYYFPDEGISHDRPVILCVANKEKKYRFFFDMKKIR